MKKTKQEINESQTAQQPAPSSPQEVVTVQPVQIMKIK